LQSHFDHYLQACHAVRQGLQELGFEMLVPDAWASPIATAVKKHPEFRVSDLTRYLAQSLGILVSGGLGPLAGKIFRVGHMGKAATRPYLMEFLFAVESFLREKDLAGPVGSSLVGLVEEA
jgi:aspartate aminotransferase-like enzyme